MRLRHISKYTYHNDILIIKAARIFRPYPTIKVPDRNFPGHSISLDIIPPVYRDISPQDLEDIPIASFNSDVYCNYFITPYKQNNQYKSFIAIKLDPNNDTYKFTEMDDRLTINIDHNWLNKTIEEGLKISKSD